MLVSTHELSHLGFVVNSRFATFVVPPLKVDHIQTQAKTMLAIASRQARCLRAKLLARFLGQVQSLALAVRAHSGRVVY